MSERLDALERENERLRAAVLDLVDMMITGDRAVAARINDDEAEMLFQMRHLKERTAFMEREFRPRDGVDV